MGMFERDVIGRLTRVESKLVRGFEELGINIVSSDDWLTVDDAARIVYVSTLGRSMTVLMSDMARLGATQFGKVYSIIHRGEEVGTVVLNKLR